MTTYDPSESLNRPRQQTSSPNPFVKLLALAILLLCVAVGMVGLILPIIPGLLFLAIAALIAASFSPALEKRMRRNAMLASYLDKTASFGRMSLQGKVKFALWLTLKVVFDSLVVMLQAVGKAIAWLRKDGAGF